MAEHRTEQEQPDYRQLAIVAARHLSHWRHQHRRPTVLDALASVPAGSGLLATAAIDAAHAGATLGQIAETLEPEGSQPTVMAPLSVHPYDDAFEELRDAAEAFANKCGHRPRVFLAGVGSIADQVARKTYATDFFEAGGFEVLAREAKSDVAEAVAAFAASRATIAAIGSTDKTYATAVAELAPKLKAAGAVAVVLAGNPGQSEAAYRAAGVDRFIYVRCNVIETLWSLFRTNQRALREGTKNGGLPAMARRRGAHRAQADR